MNFFFFNIIFHPFYQLYHFIILEFHKTNLSSSTYTNDKLRQKINEKKSWSFVDLSGMKLTSEDMKIVNSDLLANNTVINSI
jgi:hypothetical protein